MRTIPYSFLIILLTLALSSCKDWLDVNENPDSPTNDIAKVETRLPWIQHYYSYGYGTASTRAALISGTIVCRTGGSANNINLAAWNPTNGSSTTPYQYWFVGAAANLNDLITKARQEQSWHYIGAAFTIKAMGFILMADWYGEIPYTEALGESLNPVYDNGETIYKGSLADLDSALVYFNRTQPDVVSTPLSEGDEWNGGDVEKWKKLVYGLKARWLNNLSKKAEYNPTAILEAIANGPQSNAEGTIINHVNDPSDVNGDVLIGDPLKTSLVFNSAAYSDWARFTQWYVDLLENTFPGGSGVEDPRADKLLPSNQHWEKDAAGNYVSRFIRTKGVDAIHSDIRLKSGPLLSNYGTGTKKYSINSTDPARLGDTVYVNIRSLCAMTGATTEESTYTAGDGTILSTGTFYTRPESPTDVLTYHEMCFIKAEVLFRQGDKGGALLAYREGIRAHMEHMNNKLAEYSSSVNPGKQPMDESAIDAFLASDAVAQTADEMTMARIMQQKYIALSFNQQNWNDMRRFNFSAGNIADFGVVYPDFDRPNEFSSTAATKMPGGSKTDINYWFRRMAQCSHEVNYNSTNMKASNPKADKADIWSVPVWWDETE